MLHNNVEIGGLFLPEAHAAVVRLNTLKRY